MSLKKITLKEDNKDLGLKKDTTIYIPIKEGINDKNLFKCVFIAGGGGSGKSFITSMMFGKGVSPFGVKMVNSDIFFEMGLKKYGLSTIIDPKNADIYDKQMRVRSLAKELRNKQWGIYIDGMLPIIIDGTGRDYNKITSQAIEMESIGYDIYMVFVNTSLEVALERNRNRARTVPEKDAIQAWKAVQNNIGGFQTFFGRQNFVVVDNNDYLEGVELENLKNRLFMIGKGLIESPLENPIGQNVINTLKETGGKYLSDLEGII